MSDIDPHPPNPDPINPNSNPPPPGSNDVVRSKRNTRSSSNDAKLSLKNKKVIAKPHTGSLKKGSNKVNKNTDLTKEMEDIEYEDDVSEDMEVKDEVLEVNDKCSKASTGSGSQGMTGLDGGSNSVASAHDKSHVSSTIDKPNDNIGTSGEPKCSLNANVPNVVNTKVSKVSNIVGDMPVPFKDNPILNPGANVANGSGIVSSTGDKGTGNANNVWPSLMETVQTGMSSSLGVGSTSDSNDIEMQDGTNGKKFGSFVKAVQGVNNTGNNRLSMKPLRINEFGNPIIMDRITTQMCDKGYGRASYARVLVEIDAAKGLVDNVEICYNSLGRSMGLRVEYTWRPAVCSHCKVFGHNFVNCVNRVLTEEEIMEKGVTKNGAGSKPVDIEKRNVGLKSVDTEKKNKVWQDVNGRNYVRNSWGPNRGYYQQNGGPSNVNRGGFNGRGRGGFNSRGGGAQRMNNGGRNNNMQPLPTKNKEVNTDGSHEVMEKVEVDGKSKDMGNVGNRGTGDSKKFMQSELNTSNRFNALADEIIEEGSEEWHKMKHKITLACDLGMQFSVEEMGRWSKDLKKYYEEKCASKEKGKKIIELQSKMSKLQKDISYSNRNVAMTAKDKADKLCNMGMIEDGLTRNQNFSKVYDNAYKEELKRINELVREKGKAEVEFFVETEQVMTEEVKSVLDKMEDEVAEETNGNANFMTQNVVSNGMKSGSNQMQGESITKDPSIGLKSRIDKLQKNLVLSVRIFMGMQRRLLSRGL
ncbi:hypothetical protein CTI12_AA491350 [Artemisia annua]|uniref:Zinc knuckle CX2CX4HX4C n=1 Tax=Artemisia annua TaxID=35608 RepID=A0A2U1LHE1_ARTAN|nr:hypothetical protein CTI12_AA491350 [Artemisia annua]